MSKLPDDKEQDAVNSAKITEINTSIDCWQQAITTGDFSPYVIDAQPGETLKRLRKLQEYSVHDVASNLHLSSYYIKNIEEGRYDKLPSHVFARGYLRSYATLLGLDPTVVIDLFAKHVGEDAHGNITQDTRAQTGTSASIEVTKKTSILSYLLLGAITLVALFFAGHFLFSFDATEATKPAVINPTPQQQKPPTVDASPAVSSDANAISITDATANAIPSNRTTQQVFVDNQPTNSATDATLTFRFTGECWLEVREVQADGSLRYVFSGYKHDGDLLTLVNSLPVNIVFGNARAVNMQIDGKQYDFSRYIAPATQVARFTIHAQE